MIHAAHATLLWPSSAQGCTGEPLTNATGSIQVWQANNQGLYNNDRTNSGSCTTCKCR